jgi:hypothetical protein
VIEILIGLCFVFLYLIFWQLQQISGALTRVHHQLEYRLRRSNWLMGVGAAKDYHAERFQLKPKRSYFD